MIEIIQAGQAGTTSSLVEMHKVRKLIFKDRMGWDVSIDKNGLEIDEFDLPETVYILARDGQDRVAGVWRMLPTKSPSMIREIWPEFLTNFDMKVQDNHWELSRFGVHVYDNTNAKDSVRNVSQITAKLIIGLLQACNMSGIDAVYTMYNHQVARAVRKIGFYASETSDEHLIDNTPSVVGKVITDNDALERVIANTGIDIQIQPHNLPPVLKNRLVKVPINPNVTKENVYG